MDSPILIQVSIVTLTVAYLFHREIRSGMKKMVVKVVSGRDG